MTTDHLSVLREIAREARARQEASWSGFAVKPKGLLIKVKVDAMSVAPEPSGPASEEPRIERLRRLIEEAYIEHPTGAGCSFGEIICWEIHSNGQTFVWLAEKWGVPVATVGELIYDHCKRMEPDPEVRW